MDQSSEDDRTVWCGNLSNKVSEELLYELFLQAAPIERVRVCKARDGSDYGYGFVTFKHVVSVMYAVELFSDTCLFNKRISIKPRNMNLPKQRGFPYDRKLHDPPPRNIQSLSVVQPYNNNVVHIKESLDFDLLTKMGQHLLLMNKVQSNNFEMGMQTSTPIRHTTEHNGRPYRRNNYDRRNDSPYSKSYNHRNYGGPW